MNFAEVRCLIFPAEVGEMALPFQICGANLATDADPLPNFAANVLDSVAFWQETDLFVLCTSKRQMACH